jgi:hypothetical protein
MTYDLFSEYLDIHDFPQGSSSTRLRLLLSVLRVH